MISIEGINGEWILKSNKDIKVLDNTGQPVRNTVIHPLSIYQLQVKGYKEKTLVFTEPSTKDRQTYTKRVVKNDTHIRIGRNGQNEIRFNNQFVSAYHATLSFYQGEWMIKDHDSTNGTFVNGKRVKKNRALQIGDVVYIMGFKLIIGNVFIAFNNPDGRVSVDSGSTRSFYQTTG